VSASGFRTEGVHGSDPAPSGGGGLIVFVGRSPGEMSVRAEPRVRVVRVASVLEAIGELSLPEGDASDHGRAVVVLGPTALDEAPGAELADAIRLADPGVRILKVGRGDRPGHGGDGWCDGVIDERDELAATEAILNAAGVPQHGSRGDERSGGAPYPIVRDGASAHIEPRPARRDAGPAHRPEPDAEETEALLGSRRVPLPGESVSHTPPAPPGRDDNAADIGSSAGTGDEAGLEIDVAGEAGYELAESDDRVSDAWAVGDRTLVATALRGGDVLSPAMDLLRRRVNRRDIDFLPADTAATEDDDTRLGVPVVWEGRPLGMLIAGDADRSTLAALTPHAAWLAGWLRLSRQSRSLRRAAFTDPLTGAWNRRYFERFLDAAIRRARHDRLSLTVLMFDIDDFKGYNDRYGHPAGDEILIEAVRALRAVIRPSDRVCRIGGDEFAVIFFEPGGPRNPASRPPESVYVLTRRVQQKIREREFPKLGREAAGRLTISGGLATYPWDGADAESLLCRADELAIQSKRAGKNAITFGADAERLDGPAPRS